MNIEEFRSYCLNKKGVTESFPFDENTLVFKVGGKMFALCDVLDFDGINLKCPPEKAIELREQFQGILPGYHMNKIHWNTVKIGRDVPVSLILELTDLSYTLVFDSLSKKIKSELQD